MNKRFTENSFMFFLFYTLLAFAYFENLQINVLTFVGTQNIWESKRFWFFIILSILLIIFLLIISLRFFQGRQLLADFTWVDRAPTIVRQGFSILFPVLPSLVFWFVQLPEKFVLGYWSKLFSLYLAGLIAAWIWPSRNDKDQPFILRTAAFWMIGGVFYVLFSRMVFVTNYPFPLHWSEGNRFFDYSVMFGGSRYLNPDGDSIYAFISWGMQLPWALPFLVPNLTIQAYRFWYQMVWIIPPFILGFAAWKTLLRNQPNGEKGLAWVAAIFSLLFLDQGPIYTPLIIAGILVLLALRLRLLPAGLIVLLASYYAYNARWTWSYAPGLWAGLLSLLMLDEPGFSRGRFKELLRPLFLGISGLIGGRVLPILIPALTRFFQDPTAKEINTRVQIIPSITRSATRQPLIWSRLLPNPTYPLGILPGIAWVALPALAFLIYLTIKGLWRINWLQKISAILILAALFGVGLTASVKIGGGSNLHNLDMFLVTLLLLMITATLPLTKGDALRNSHNTFVPIFLFIVMVFPITFTIRNTEKPELPDASSVQQTLNTVRNEVSELNVEDEILFIDHRQLLTFNFVPQVPLVDEYEKKKLMNEAIGGNAPYFEPFLADISRQRFKLIISEPLNIVIRGEDYSFGKENDEYVRWVTAPLICNYEPIYTDRENKLELLVPRSIPLNSALIDCDTYSINYSGFNN